MAQAFLQGLQAAQQQTLGQLQIEGAVSDIQARRRQQDKATRIQGYLGGYGEAPSAERAQMEGQVATEDVEMAEKLRTFRTSGEAEIADRLGEVAAVASQAIGTNEEPQALLWLAQEAEKIGVPRETIQQTVEAAIQNPEGGRRAVQLMVARGMGAKEYLAQYETEKDVKKFEREQKGKERLVTLKQKGKKPPAREQKIADTVTDYGVSEKEARDIVDGRVKLETDPLSGQSKLINIASGEVRTLGAPPPPEDAPREVAEDIVIETPTGEPKETVFDMLGEAVGAGAVGREILSTTAGQLFESARFPETTTARTKLKALKNKLVVALAISGRPPGFEQKNILEMLPSTGIFEEETNAAAQLTELHGMLSRQVMDDMAFFNDPAEPKAARGKARERARAITAVIRELGSPPAAEQTIDTQEEYDALPSGATYIDAQTGDRGTKP